MLDGASHADFILLDGHEFRSPHIKAATEIAVSKGWLALGPLKEGDQWSWYEAKITKEGRKAIKAWKGAKKDVRDPRVRRNQGDRPL